MERDKKLIKRIKKNSDKTAASELVSMYYKEVYSYIYKQILDKELSMDLTQEIFISILKSIYSFDEKKASFRTWIYKIATYRLIDYYRSKNYKYNSRIVPIDDLELYHNEDIEIAAENKEDVERIISVVDSLDISFQQIFRLKIFADYTFLEISNILGVPESTVKTRYYSTLKKIREYFKEG